MGGQESINEKLRRPVGSKLMDCFFGPQPLKGATRHSAVCARAHCPQLSCTLPHSELSGAARCVSRNKREALCKARPHIPQTPLCSQARVLVYILPTTQSYLLTQKTCKSSQLMVDARFTPAKLEYVSSRLIRPTKRQNRKKK